MLYLNGVANGDRLVARSRVFEASTTGVKALLSRSSRRVLASVQEHANRASIFTKASRFSTSAAAKAVTSKNGKQHLNLLLSTLASTPQASRSTRPGSDIANSSETHATSATSAINVLESSSPNSGLGTASVAAWVRSRPSVPLGSTTPLGRARTTTRMLLAASTL